MQSLEDIGKHLDRGRDAYEKTLNRMTLGKGNLVSRVSRLETVGAKVKKTLPTSLIDRAEIDGIDFDEVDDN